MPRRLAHASALAIAIGFAASAGAQNTKFTARDAGEVTIRYGTPVWREELLNMITPGSFWRLGSGGATTIETTAAIAAKEGVVFPGTYNLNLDIGAKKDEWGILFHKDGANYKDGPQIALFALTKGEIADQAKVAPRLQIDLEADRDKARKAAGGAVFRVRFGPHQVEGPLWVAGVAKKRVNLDPVAFAFETVKLPAVDEFQKVVDGKAAEPFPFARITLERGQAATVLALGPGEEPVVQLKEFQREIKGTRSVSATPAPVLKAVIELGQLKVQLGTAVLTFPFEAALLTKAATGATTPKKPGD